MNFAVVKFAECYGFNLQLFNRGFSACKCLVSILMGSRLTVLQHMGQKSSILTGGYKCRENAFLSGVKIRLLLGDAAWEE